MNLRFCLFCKFSNYFMTVDVLLHWLTTLKIFNPNTLKLSYYCMKNLSNIIKQYNATVLATSTTPKSLCNCRNKDTCPLDECFLKQCFIYYGAGESDFKLRYNNHTNSFRNRYYEHATELILKKHYV